MLSVQVAAMASLPSDFIACDKETLHDDPGEETMHPSFQARNTMVIGKCLRWSAWPLNSAATTGEAFDHMWTWLGTQGKRHLSIRRGSDNSLWALLFKGDQAELDLATAPEEVRLAARYEITKPGSGQAATRAIANFIRGKWFCGAETTSNFQVSHEAPVDFGSVFESVKDMEAEEYLQHKAHTKLNSDREPKDKALLRCSSEVQGLRRLERKRESKRKLQDGIVFRVGEPGCTKLIYPNDVPSLAGKLGRTYNPLTKHNETATVSDYVESKLHLEKTLVLWGAGGNQKTLSAEAIAKDFAIRYNTQYIKGNGPEALKKVQDEFDRLVTVIFEEFSADDVAQHGKRLSVNYFKHLLDVPNGGQVRVHNVMLHFTPLQPRIICINDTPKDWLRAIEGVKDTDNLPLKKRILFVHVDELVISPAAVAAYEADLDQIVNAGKRRRLEYNGKRGIEHKVDETPSTTASVDGGSTGNASDPEFGLCPAGEEPCQELWGGVCAECLSCPPAGEEGGGDDEKSFDIPAEICREASEELDCRPE